MKKWKMPPAIKVYEAIGALGDERIHITEASARVYSSSGNKFYTVLYDEMENKIMVNDNGSFFKGYLGYPAIAYLMLSDILPRNTQYEDALRGVAWKDINQKNKNDFAVTMKDIDTLLENKGIAMEDFKKFVDEILRMLKKQKLGVLGEKAIPPEGY